MIRIFPSDPSPTLYRYQLFRAPFCPPSPFPRPTPPLFDKTTFHSKMISPKTFEQFGAKVWLFRQLMALAITPSQARLLLSLLFNSFSSSSSSSSSSSWPSPPPWQPELDFDLRGEKKTNNVFTGCFLDGPDIGLDIGLSIRLHLLVEALRCGSTSIHQS